jgi:tetratricopeptide (TPR) repeat protein
MSVNEPRIATGLSCAAADDIAERLLAELPVAPREAAALAAHRTACASCQRFESALDALAAPAALRPGEVLELVALVTGPDQAPARRRPLGPGEPRPARRVAPALLALAALVVAVTAAWLLQRAVSAPDEARAPARRSAMAPPTRAPRPGPPAPVIGPGPLAPEDATPVKPAPPRRRLERPMDVSPPQEAPPLPEIAIPPREPGAPAPDPDEALLAEARRRRIARDYAGAAARYRQLADQRGSSVTGLSARVSLGYVLLDHLRQPANALLEFDRVLRGQGQSALAEEALHGRARALRELGRPTEERAAIRIFLSRFPTSLRAPALRQRLAEISESEP